MVSSIIGGEKFFVNSKRKLRVRGADAERLSQRDTQLHELAHGVGGTVGIGTDGDSGLDLQRGGESIQPGQEGINLAVVGGFCDLAQIVDEDVGNIVIASVQTANEATQNLKKKRNIGFPLRRCGSRSRRFVKFRRNDIKMSEFCIILN